MCCCRVDFQPPPGQPGYTDNVLQTALDRVTSRHPDSVAPWSDEAMMSRDTEYVVVSDMWQWQLDVAWIQQNIDVTRAELRRLRETESESD